MRSDTQNLGKCTFLSTRLSSAPVAVAMKSRYASERSLVYWHLIQYLLFAASIALVILLFVKPIFGLDILWNILIPVAPALIVIAPGLWRNICPLATLNLLPRHLGISQEGSLTRRQAAYFSAGSLLALFIIVPYRHISLDTNGPLSALMLITAGTIAFVMGVAFKWRSGWCTTMCPIHPVERLYGIAPAITFRNTRCVQCDHCTTPCPDSTRSMTAAITGTSRLATITGHIMIGSFAGFIWGWYQLPDYSGDIVATHYLYAYLWPLGSALASLAIYAILRQWIVATKKGRNILTKVFATTAVSTYYWFRIPALVGLGPYHGTGMLYDLAMILPTWLEHLSHVVSTSFFVWFMLLRSNPGASWMKRPIST